MVTDFKESFAQILDNVKQTFGQAGDVIKDKVGGTFQQGRNREVKSFNEIRRRLKILPKKEDLADKLSRKFPKLRFDVRDKRFDRIDVRGSQQDLMNLDPKLYKDLIFEDIGYGYCKFKLINELPKEMKYFLGKNLHFFLKEI